MAKVLFIVSGATYWVPKDGTGYATGYRAEEFAMPYKKITEAGHEVVVGTPGGVTPNVDMMSLFGAAVGRPVADGRLELLERTRFQHRVTTTGEPVFYRLVVGRRG
ncbi:hypothetical protein ACIRBZ_26605 [Streptomyces sp. NPDC094038]|uniref:hypothetical protein n=1 Tax=Streptomyces sp. NPDC094038 TaxID=3366055 RepID=UPI0038053300